MRAQAHLPLHTAVLSSPHSSPEFWLSWETSSLLVVGFVYGRVVPGGVPTWTEMDPRRWRGTQFMLATCLVDRPTEPILHRNGQ